MDAVGASEVAELCGYGAAQACVAQGQRAQIRLIVWVIAVEVVAAPHARVVHTLRVRAVALEGDRAHACGTVPSALEYAWVCDCAFAWV